MNKAMKFFIKIYLKLINNFWKLVLLKIAKSIVFSIDYAPALQICIKMLNDIDLLNLNCIVVLIISSCTSYVYYKIYLENCNKTEQAYKTLKVSYSELARFNILFQNAENNDDDLLNNQRHLIAKVKKWTYYLNFYKDSLDSNMLSMFVNYLLFSMSFVGLSITYDTEKFSKAYKLAKTWSRSLIITDSIFYNKLFKNNG